MERLTISEASSMSLSELLPTIDQLSHQDKLRLIHFLLLAVAKEEGFNLEPTREADPENALIQQLASTEAVVWSPQTDSAKYLSKVWLQTWTFFERFFNSLPMLNNTRYPTVRAFF